MAVDDQMATVPERSGLDGDDVHFLLLREIGGWVAREVSLNVSGCDRPDLPEPVSSNDARARGFRLPRPTRAADVRGQRQPGRIVALIDVSFGLALTAGSVAAFNPCGFAMLPAYLGFFVREDESLDASRSTAVVRALVVSAAMTAGFMLVFGSAGLLIDGASVAVGDITPWLTVGIGVVMVPTGMLLIFGRTITVHLPRLQRGGSDRRLGSMCLFGMSYATVSLSCTLPVFLTAVSGSFRSGGFGSGLVSYAAYAIGMGLVITTLTVAIALARDGLIRRIRRALPYLNRIAGALLVLAGMYVAYYGYWEIRILGGHDVPEGPVAWVSDWSARATQRVDDLGVLVIVVALMALLGESLLRRRRSVSSPSPNPDPAVVEPSTAHPGAAP
jgi:cytochrome c-type biogenesis protein